MTDKVLFVHNHALRTRQKQQMKYTEKGGAVAMFIISLVDWSELSGTWDEARGRKVDSLTRYVTRRIR